MNKDQVKKSPKANLEPQKGTYWLMGIVVAVALVFLALEWTTTTRQLDESALIIMDEPEEELLITRHEPPPPPPPPPVDLPPEIPEILIETEYEVETQIIIAQEGEITPPAPPPPPPTAVAPPPPPIEQIWEFVEDPPVFGHGDLNAWLSRNIRYPQSALEMGVHGTVVLQFVIERDGSVTDIQVVRGVDPALNREAERVVRSMPAWTPARQAGETVRFRFTLPVRFVLSN